MCLVEEFTDVYPMEIRTRSVIHRCLFSNGTETCKSTRVRDRGKFYHIRHTQPRETTGMAPPRYQIIEPRESIGPRVPPISLPRKTPSQARSHPLKLRFPFIRRDLGPEEERNVSKARGRERAPRPFVVDVPEDNFWSRQRTEVSASPQIRSISPRTKVPCEAEKMEQVDDFDQIPREARPLKLPRSPRPPRERTPVAEREPLRRRQRQTPARLVEVHNNRHVHFSSEIDSDGHVDRNKERHEAQRQPPQSSPLASNGGGNGQNGDESAGHQHYTPEGRPHLETRTPRFVRELPERRRTFTAPDSNHVRPRIIQDGDRQMSEAGERILVEAQRRQSRENFIRDFRSYAGWRPWNRRTESHREFNSGDERIRYDTGYRQHGWRWR